jgi:hypothetical protein
MLHNYPLLASIEAYLAHHVSKNGEAYLTHVKQNILHLWPIVLHLRQLCRIVWHIWLCAGTYLQWVCFEWRYSEWNSGFITTILQFEWFQSSSILIALKLRCQKKTSATSKQNDWVKLPKGTLTKPWTFLFCKLRYNRSYQR